KPRAFNPYKLGVRLVLPIVFMIAVITMFASAALVAARLLLLWLLSLLRLLLRWCSAAVLHVVPAPVRVVVRPELRSRIVLLLGSFISIPGILAARLLSVSRLLVITMLRLRIGAILIARVLLPRIIVAILIARIR